MDKARNDPDADLGGQVLLAVLLTVACIIGIPPLVETVVQSIAQSKSDALRTGLGCKACGVVEDVRELTQGVAKHGVSTVAGDGMAMFFALLSGKLRTDAMKLYEVEVRLQDGSVRVIREATPPDWKQGDRVKVVMGRIKLAS
jgi:hypothetical protein